MTYRDLRPLLASDRIPLALPAGGICFDVDPFVLAYDEVCYVGEPIILVVAASRRIAEDAVASIDVEIDPLPVVDDPVAGLDAAAGAGVVQALDRFSASGVTVVATARAAPGGSAPSGAWPARARIMQIMDGRLAA